MFTIKAAFVLTFEDRQNLFKELDEILRIFDKAPSSERNNHAQMRQNNLQSRQVSQNPIDAERTVRTTNQTAYKRQPQSSKGRYLSPKRKAAIKRRKRQRIAIVLILALFFVVLIIVLICKDCSGRTDALAGKWDFDGTTAYEFDGKGVGTMVLPSVSYDFKYEINGNELYIDFINESVHDSTYSFTVQTNTLTLVGGNDTAVPGKVYELTKQE